MRYFKVTRYRCNYFPFRDKFRVLASSVFAVCRTGEHGFAFDEIRDRVNGIWNDRPSRRSEISRGDCNDAYLERRDEGLILYTEDR